VGHGDRGREIVGSLLVVDALLAGYRMPVVGPISFTLDTGEIVGLAGPNGAGKSTILGAIIGTAKVFGGTIVRRPDVRVAIQHQRPARLSEMPITGREFLAITGAHRHAPPAALAPLLGQRLDRLSGGQYQLLHVWACLGSPAEFVLLDEPTNNLDPQATSTLRDILRSSRERGRGVLVISHDHEILDEVCTRVVEVAA
jgi:zinc transport system ATP-binding protein